LPGGKAARFGIDQLFEGVGDAKWFEAAVA